MAIITKYLTMYPLNDEYTLFVNSLSGAVDIVNKEQLKKVNLIKENTSLEKIDDSELVNTLIERNYLFDDEKDEAKILERNKKIYDRYMEKDNQRLTFVFCPTMACNLKCVYCFENDDVKNNGQVMSIEQVENITKIIDKILIERKPKHPTINLFGGEPLLPTTIEVNRKIINYAVQMKMPVNIITNGTNIEIFKETLNMFREHHISFQITVDGIQKVHDKRRIRKDNSGTFAEITNNIDWLLESNFFVKLRVNIDRENIDYLKEFVDFITKKGWNSKKNFYCDVAPVLDHAGTGRIPNYMTEDEVVKKIATLFPNYTEKDSFFKLGLLKVLHHINSVMDFLNPRENLFRFHYCEANVMKFYVFAPDNYIYACPESVGNKDCIIGTFDTELTLFPEKVNQWVGRTVLRVPKCRDCSIAMFCGGGCAMAALKTNQDIDNPICNNAKQVLEEYVHSVKDKIVAKYC